MSKIFNHTFPSAVAFNNIPHFDALSVQERTLAPELLDGLRDIYVKHNVHQTLAAGILHRHQFLADGEIILHTIQNDHVDIAEIKNTKALDADSYHGCAFFWNSGVNAFQPFEFTVNAGAISLPVAFLEEVREFLGKNDLLTRVAIIMNPLAQGMGATYEYTIADGSVNIRIPHRQITPKAADLDLSPKNVTTEAVTICKGGMPGCGVSSSAADVVVICKGGMPGCRDMSSATTEAVTICKGGMPGCGMTTATTEAVTICKGGMPGCGASTSTTEAVTICKGGMPGCGMSTSTSTIEAVTICKGGMPGCGATTSEASTIEAVTICKGGMPGCGMDTTAAIESVTICKGGMPGCGASVTEAVTICKGGMPGCSATTSEASAVEAVTICKGGMPGCGMETAATIESVTICKGGMPGCGASATEAVTICKGGMPGCGASTTTSTTESVTICKGGMPGCGANTSSQEEQACEWAFTSSSSIYNKAANNLTAAYTSTVCVH